MQLLYFCLKRCNLILCATCIDFRCQRLAEKFFQRLSQILDLRGQRLDSRKQFSASGLKSVRIYLGINDDRAVSLICHLTTFFLSRVARRSYPFLPVLLQTASCVGRK